jgi:hypothetical protein
MPLETEPIIKVPKNHVPSNSEKYKVKDGDSWESIAKRIGVDVWDLIYFNFKTKNPREVNWYLGHYDYVGCKTTTTDGKNWRFSASAKPGIIYLPIRVGDKVMNTSIHHQVPIMVQPKTRSCWYTSLQMVVRYYRNRGRVAGLKDPSEDHETQQLYLNNTGISDRERIVNKLGFATLHMSLTKEGMWEMLNKGPVIYAGHWPGLESGHWVVLVGISENTLAINNPATGFTTWDYNQFMGQYLLQTSDRPLIYVP